MQITTAELATALDTTPREVRKFLRSDASGIESVGKGSRYAITKGQVRSLKARYAKWDAARTPAPADEVTAPDAS